MTSHRITPPPASLLHADAAPPAATTVVAEVRSEAVFHCDPQEETPEYLSIPHGVKFTALVHWRVNLSLVDADWVNAWLRNPPPSRIATSGEEALKHLINGLKTDDGRDFATYLGTYISCDCCRTSYTLAIGLRGRVTRDEYNLAWDRALDDLSKTNPKWFAEVLDFVRCLRARESSHLEFLILARHVYLKNLPVGRHLIP